MKPKKRTPCLLCAVVLAAAAALGRAQEKSHDALAVAREHAKAQNQRVLLFLNDGESKLSGALASALSNYRGLGKLVKYEYQLVSLPADALAAKALRRRLGLADRKLPLLAALDTKDSQPEDSEATDRLLGALDSQQMVADDAFSLPAVRGFLEKHKCEPLVADDVLARARNVAKKSKRQVFVYLSAPW